MKPKLESYKGLILFSIFAAFTYVVFAAMYADFLFTVQERNLFVGSSLFMDEILSRPTGFVGWVGCYLTQFFYYPALGTSVMLLLWAVIYFCLVRAFRLHGWYKAYALIPLACIQIAILNAGYWIYYIHLPGYFFYPTLALLIVALMLYVASFVVDRFVGREQSLRRRATMVFIAIAAFVVLMSLGMRVPLVASPTCTAPHLTYSLYVGIAVTILLPLLPQVQLPVVARSMALVVLLLSCGAVVCFSYDDSNFRHELRMYRAVDRCDWDAVMAEVETQGDVRPTHLMVMFKNLALLNQGRLKDDMFKYSNEGCQPSVSDSLRVHMSQQAGPLLYYFYGMPYFAYRWSIENSVRYGLTTDNLKMLVRSAIFNQEFDVAEKYLLQMRSLLFYKDWVREHRQMLTQSRVLTSSKEYNAVSPLVNYPNELDFDEGFPANYILQYYTNIVSPMPLSEELSLCFSLQTEAGEDFMIHFLHYYENHKNEPMPLLFQQAAYMFGQRESCPIDVSNFPFDPVNVVQKFEDFTAAYQAEIGSGRKISDIGRALRPRYGDTYWWYYYFYSDFNLY